MLIFCSSPKNPKSCHSKMPPMVTLVNFKYLGPVKQGMEKSNERFCSSCSTHSSCFSVASLSDPQASMPLSSVTVLHYRPNLPACGRNQNIGGSVAWVSNCSPREEATSFPWVLSPHSSLLSLLGAGRETDPGNKVVEGLELILGNLSRDVFEPRTLTGSLCSCF